MSMQEITKKVNNLGQNWHEFKSVNDQRLKQIERKGAVDCLTENYLAKLNSKMDRQEQQIDKIKAALNRPKSPTDNHINEEKSQYDQELDRYLRKGIEPRFEQKGLSDLNNTDFGYAMTSNMSNDMDLLIAEKSPMRLMANVTEISTDMYEIIDSRYRATTDWGDNGLKTNEDISNPIANKIIAHPLHCQFTISQKVANDPRIDIQKMVSTNISYNFAKKESEAFINGDGIDKPKGILKYDDGKGNNKIERVKSKSGENKIKFDDIMNLLHKLPGTYQTDAKFLMSFEALHELRTLKDNENRYLINPHSIEKGYSSLLGLEVFADENMGGVAKNKIAVAVADFKYAYQIIYRNLSTVIVDQVTKKGKNIYFSTTQVGGAINNAEAIKLLEIS